LRDLGGGTVRDRIERRGEVVFGELEVGGNVDHVEVLAITTCHGVLAGTEHDGAAAVLTGETGDLGGSDLGGCHRA